MLTTTLAPAGFSGATPAEVLFVLGVVAESRDDRFPFALRNSASVAFYRLTELVRSRGLRTRTKLTAHARYGKLTACARLRYEAAAAKLTPAELQHHAAHFVAEWQRYGGPR